LAVANLKLASVVLPRTESPEAISRLAEFEWFHKIDTKYDKLTPEVDDLLLEAQKLYQSIDEVVKKMELPPTVGIMEILFKGTMIKKRKYEMSEISSLISDIKDKAPGIIDGPAKILADMADAKRALEEYQTLKGALEALKRLNISIDGFGLMRYFYVNLFVVNTADADEIARSLEGAAIARYELGVKEKTAVLIISGAGDADRIVKIMRNFNSAPFGIPEGLPQVPSEAFAVSEAKIKELSEKRASLEKELASVKKRSRADIMSLHESAMMANADDCHDVADILRADVRGCGARPLAYGTGANLQDQRTGQSGQMGNADCNIRRSSCHCRSRRRRGVWIPHRSSATV